MCKAQFLVLALSNERRLAAQIKEAGERERGKKGKHTTLPTIILITGIFFQVGDINHFAFGKCVIGRSHGDRIAKRAVSTGGEATAAVECDVSACRAVVWITEESDFPVCLDLAGCCWG